MTGPATTHYLELKEICKKYGKTQALQDMSLHLDTRERLVILGPSGAGKTTTLKIIAGLEPATSGKVFFKGRLINHLEPKDRNMAMVFETYVLYPQLSVFDNIASSLKALGMASGEIRERTEKIAKTLGIFDFLDRKPRFLSGGQRQRVALGRALVKPADLFLFDEPIAHLDAKLRYQMIGEFKHLSESLGISLIYVTHDWREAMSLGHRVVVLNNGIVEQCASPIDVYRRPASSFVAQMVGDPPMNLIPGEISNESQVSRFRGAGFNVKLKKRMESGTVSLGVRPSKFVLSSPSERDGEAEVYSSGKHGMNTVVTLRTDGVTVKTELVETAKFVIGQKISIRIDLQGACLFDRNQRLLDVLEG
jgi:ABC-type sugar transport system ATPase subunit